MNIKPKLYLNNSPQTAEEGSLAFARNMKVDDDGNLVSDYGYEDIENMANHKIVGHIVGLDNKIYFFCHNYSSGTYYIIEYNELTKTGTVLNTQWTYHGGTIDGCVNTNVSGEKILTIAESGENISNQDIPLKHINLSYATVPDESFYCQAPECPTANLILKNTYVKTIPNGVYVFFIRYKLRKDVYTNWFLCSRPIFGGTSEKMTTFQGGLKYVNLHKDSAKSFVFQLDFANIPDSIASNLSNIYPEFQLGFIITHDEATDARTWKHFKMSEFKTSNVSDTDNLVYFYYENVEEANIDDLLETTYELYNVGNVAAFKNKLYISNYKETNFNLDIDVSHYIQLDTEHIDSNTRYDIYNTLRLKLGQDSYTLDKETYDLNANCFVNAKINNAVTSIQTILSDYLNVTNIDNVFDFTLSDFYKGETTEYDNILSVLFTGDVTPDPDIIYCKSVINNVASKMIFAEDFTVSYDSSGLKWLDIGIDPEKVSAWGPSAYRIKVRGLISKRHKWHNDENLTYGYGAFGNDNEYVPEECKSIAKGNIIPINYNTLLNNQAAAGAHHFTDELRSTIKTLIEKDITSKSRLIFGYATIYSGTKEYVIPLPIYGYDKSNFDADNFAGLDKTHFNISYKTNSNGLLNRFKQELGRIIQNNVYGIDDSGNLTLAINGEYVKVNNMTFTVKACEFVLSDTTELNTNDDDTYNVEFKFKLKSTYYHTLCTFGFKASALSIIEYDNNEDWHKQQSTLMPISTYDAYIHFVDKHNIISNGFKYPTPIETTNITNFLEKIILKYKVNELHPDYKSFFVSLKRIGNHYIETFGQTIYNGLHIVHVLEADALLYNINDNITIVSDSDVNTPITETAKYYPSGAAIPAIAFGNCGFIAWKDNETSIYNSRLYVKIIGTTEKDNSSLVKATPYIPLQPTNGYVNVEDGFYGGYFCSVKKPSFDLSSICYVSGSDIYAASRETTITLKEFDNYISIQDSRPYFIRSDFNLNYLSLTEDITDRLYRIGSSSLSLKQVAKAINSATLSSIYELKSMYKDFANKYFREVTTDYTTKFDNTIRVSRVLSDETFNNSIFKFGATDYYNVPTDRGPIVNLFSIANDIFAHTTASLYKFDGNQTIVSSEKDITLQESDPFITGISQVLDSEYGYGGIRNKEAGCITFDSYLFYDSISNHIFSYGGNSQLQLIDGTIYKLLSYFKPNRCKTLHDEENRRVLFQFSVDDEGFTYNSFTLSYNYKSKSFVSFHDINLNNAFHSRYKSYSYNYNNIEEKGLLALFDTSNGIDTTVYDVDLGIYSLFGKATTACFIKNQGIEQDSPFTISVITFPKDSFIQVIDSVKYVGSLKFNGILPANDYYLLAPYETILIKTNPVDNFYIITDSCISTAVTDTVDDTARPNTLLDYKGFKYDKGSWNTNYFRSDTNANNIYEYPNQPGVDIPTSDGPKTRHPNSDNNSLVYGRYFILVFNFIKDNPIKIEQVSINSNPY